MLEMTDFGFDPPTLGAGLIQADNEVVLTIDFAARPAGGPSARALIAGD